MLSRQHRVVRGNDYRDIVRSGRRLNSPYCMLHVRVSQADDPARFGFIITKAVGKAHIRNLIRRRYKAIAHELIQTGIHGLDVVVRAHPSSAEAEYRELRDTMTTLISTTLNKNMPSRVES